MIGALSMEPGRDCSFLENQINHLEDAQKLLRRMRPTKLQNLSFTGSLVESEEGEVVYISNAEVKEEKQYLLRRLKTGTTSKMHFFLASFDEIEGGN